MEIIKDSFINIQESLDSTIDKIISLTGLIILSIENDSILDRSIALDSFLDLEEV